MLTRRHTLTLAAAGLAASLAAPAFAQDWKAKYPELVYAVVPAENASGVTGRYGPFIEQLSKDLGVKVTLRIANDYAAVIEGHRAGNVHIGEHGPSSYIRAWTVTNGGVEPFFTPADANGNGGYYSVAYVRTGDPYQKIEDLKGKNLGLVDPNSTSGYNVPLFALDKIGIDHVAFFGKTLTTGSHENAITALKQGTVDVAFNWFNAETDSNLSRMVGKGMVKADEFRVIFKSDKIAGYPFVYIKSLPDDLKAAIRKSISEMPKTNKAAYDQLFDGKSTGMLPVKHEDYLSALELQKFVDNLRRKRS
jgi:phosphonate transport system substrate-binding protein